MHGHTYINYLIYTHTHTLTYLLNVSEAAPKMDTSWAPACTWIKMKSQERRGVTHGCFKSFHIRNKYWISHARFPLNGGHHFSMVTHLRIREREANCMHSLVLVRTCGTHLGETKLVASITLRPVSDSLSISWTLTSVGTTVWENECTRFLQCY